MPTYDYRCNTCGIVFEHFQSMKDDALRNCLCGKNGEVTRIISSGGGIIFKGTGFYVTDYKKNSSDNKSDSTPSTTPAPTTPVKETKTQST